MTSDQSLPTHLAHSAGPRLFVALWGGLAVVDVSRAGQLPASVQVAALTALAAVCAVGQRPAAALAAAGVVWLVVLGFVVNRWGELEPSGPGDLVPLALLVGVALTTAVATR